MATRRPDIPITTKRWLIEEAGLKCANPGCVNSRTHIHHIKEWAVYQTHDKEHMIAVCPTCHDAIHNGDLPIDDDTVYRWKAIKRTPTRRDHIYVEPGEPTGLLLGSFEFRMLDERQVFEISENNRFSYRIHHGDTMALYITLTTLSGRELLKVVEGHVKHEAEPPLRYERVPGHVRLVGPPSPDYAPEWAISLVRAVEPSFGADGSIPLVDLEVVEPGLVRVQGMWVGKGVAIVITEKALRLLRPGLLRPVSLVGHGRNTVLQYSGPVNTPMLKLGATLTNEQPLSQHSITWTSGLDDAVLR